MSQPLHVLIVEDNPFDSELVLRELRRAGFEPTWQRVETEPDYIARLEGKFDIILSDYRMPQFDGLRALELLKERELDIPFIIVSGSIGEETAVEAIKQGAADYILKDRLARLGTAVHQALGQAGLRRDRKVAREALRLRERALEEVSQGVVICDENFRVLYVNTGFTNITGYEGSEVVGRTCAMLQGQDSDPAVIEKMRTALRMKTPFEGEILNYRKGGTPYWNELSVAPISDPAGGPVRFIGIQRNVTERKRAETALRESRRFLQSTLDALASHIAILDEQGTIIEVNAAWNRFARENGFAGSALGVGDNYLHICRSAVGVFSDEASDVAQGIDAVMTGQSEEFFQEYPCHSPWEKRWFIVRVTRFAGEGSVRLVVAHENISVRKLAEEALRWKTAFFETLADSVPDGVLVVDRDGRKVHQNRMMGELWGIPTEIAESTDDGRQIEFVTGRTRNPQQFAERVAYLYSHPDEVSRDEIEVVGGTVLDRYSAPVKNDAGQYYGRIWAFRDITAERRAAEVLRRQKTEIQILFDLIPAMILFKDTNDVILRVNRKFAEAAGKSVEEIEGRSSSAVFPEYATQFFDFDREVMESGIPKLGFVHAIGGPKGENLWIQTDRVPVSDQAGTIIGVIVMITDITKERMREEKLSAALDQEKELSEQARAGDRAKSEFLAVMSHEIRTPMNGILGFSEMLEAMPDLPADCREYVETITSSGEALLRILDDILAFSRLEAGGVALEKGMIGSREILESIHALLAPDATDKHLAFHLAIDEGAGRNFWNDGGRLRQVLLNIVGNALKFTATGSITLGVRPSGEMASGGAPGVEFFVRDTGPGISKDEMDHVFEPFVQADSSISRRYGGTGLGLSISRNLVSLMGGTLTVHSEVGIGSEFCVTLPVGLEEAPAVPVLPAIAVPTLDAAFAADHPMRILLVEDDAVNLKLLGMMLRRLGYEPLVARDGEEAVEIFRREHPSFILMDLQMPRKDGLQATIEIRELERQTLGGDRANITALTANIVGEIRQQCFEVGMDGYLNKPIKRAQLAIVLAEVSAAQGGA